MCRILILTISGYYAWLIGKLVDRQQRENVLAALMMAAHKASRETCSTERLHAELINSGVEITEYKVRRLRTQLSLRYK